MKKFLAIAIVAGIVALATAAHTEKEYEFLFSKYIEQHGKSYGHDQFYFRYVTFKQNLDHIEKHNARNLPYKLAMNEYGDMTATEFKKTMLRYRSVGDQYKRSQNVDKELEASAAPTSVDWTTKGVVTPVKNQGQCGSCWAFSTTGSIEGAHAIATGKLVSLSEQQLVDCSGSFGNAGCNGGLMDQGFEYVIKTGGLCTESAYPYTAQDGTCKASSCTREVKISSYKDVTHDSESAMKAAIAQQPVSIAIEADQSSFQFYSSGVMTGSCGATLDHGVLAVGYGSSNGQDYWKVKNSWGASWGMSGYILLARGGNYNSGAGQCGILSEPSYPIV